MLIAVMHKRLRRCSTAIEVSPGDEQEIQLTKEGGCHARGEVVILLDLLEGVENELCPATCRLEDEAPAGRRCGKISIDAQRHLCAVCMLAFFRIEPHDPRERGSEIRRIAGLVLFGVGVMSLSFEFTCI